MDKYLSELDIETTTLTFDPNYYGLNPGILLAKRTYWFSLFGET